MAREATSISDDELTAGADRKVTDFESGSGFRNLADLTPMDASVSFRLPALALPKEKGRTSQTYPVQSASEDRVSDEALMAQICNGSMEALATLFRRYARLVRFVSYRVLRDSSEADDTVQDVFVFVHQECASFDGSKGPARFWILQMAYRRAISRRRYLTSRHFYTRLDLNDAADELADPRSTPAKLDDLIHAGLENPRLHGVFTSLSDSQQKTLGLFFMEGYTLDEIAAKLGQSRGNVKHHYFRGLERLRKELFGSKLPGERAI